MLTNNLLRQAWKAHSVQLALVRRLYKTWTLENRTLDKLKADLENGVKEHSDKGISHQWITKPDNTSQVVIQVKNNGTSIFKFSLLPQAGNKVLIKEDSRDLAFTHTFFEEKIDQGLDDLIAYLNKNQQN